MYISAGMDVEASCYDYEHIRKVLKEIKQNFEGYFQRFLKTNAGNGLTDEAFAKLQKKFGVAEKNTNPVSGKKLSANYKSILRESLVKFEKDQEDYVKIMNIELLEDLVDDADYFKSVILRNKCPIIRKTLANKKAAELDKYRGNFSRADADWLLAVVTNLCAFADTYAENYEEEAYESCETYEDLNLDLMDTDDYTVYGVIGGGIKTHMLYKVYPGLFPNRSRSALWALWYLSGKSSYDCSMDSEFLMIDTDKGVAQQNYFYPYTLFAYYAFELYKLLREKAALLDAYIDPDYRYIIVDAFFEFVSFEHEADISVMRSQIRDGGMGLA